MSRPHWGAAEPMSRPLDPSEDISQFDQNLKTTRQEIDRMQTTFPSVPPISNPMDSRTGLDLLFSDLDQEAGQQVYPTSIRRDPYIQKLDFLDNGYSKTLVDINAKTMQLASDFLGDGASFHDEANSVGNDNDPWSHIMRTGEIIPTMYDNHPVFRGTSITNTLRLKNFVMNEVLNLNGFKHLRDISSLNLAWSMMPMKYKDWKNMSSDGRSAPPCIWPRSADFRSRKRNELLIPQLPDKQQRDHWGFEPWNMYGYVVNDTTVGLNQHTVCSRGLLRNEPDLWNMSLCKPQQGVGGYFMTVLRVAGLSMEKAQRMAEFRGDVYPIQDNDIVTIRLEPIVAPYGRPIPRFWYETAHMQGSVFKVVHFHLVNDMNQMESKEPFTRRALFPEDNGVNQVNANLANIDKIDFFLDVMNM